ARGGQGPGVLAHTRSLAAAARRWPFVAGLAFIGHGFLPFRLPGVCPYNHTRIAFCRPTGASRMSNVEVKGANWGNIATSGSRILNVTGDNGLNVQGDLTINQVPLVRQWLRPAEADPLKRWEQALGRQDELARLSGRLAPASEAAGPTAVWGMPGVGKSTLAA